MKLFVFVAIGFVSRSCATSVTCCMTSCFKTTDNLVGQKCCQTSALTCNNFKPKQCRSKGGKFCKVSTATETKRARAAESKRAQQRGVQHAEEMTRGVSRLATSLSLPADGKVISPPGKRTVPWHFFRTSEDIKRFLYFVYRLDAEGYQYGETDHVTYHRTGDQHKILKMYPLRSSTGKKRPTDTVKYSFQVGIAMLYQNMFQHATRADDAAHFRISSQFSMWGDKIIAAIDNYQASSDDTVARKELLLHIVSQIPEPDYIKCWFFSEEEGNREDFIDLRRTCLGF